MHAAALAEDASVFDYDSHFDSIQEARAEPKQKEKMARESRYIASLLETAEERKMYSMKDSLPKNVLLRTIYMEIKRSLLLLHIRKNLKRRPSGRRSKSKSKLMRNRMQWKRKGIWVTFIVIYLEIM